MNKIIVQFALSDDTDFDDLIHIEDALILELLPDRSAEVDGHDIGEGRFNIYIHLQRGWQPALGHVIEALKRLNRLEDSVVAKLYGETNAFEVVWPEGYVGRFAL
jgi:hypothetical protein